MDKHWVPSSFSVHLHPHLAILRQNGVAIERELERENLPVELIDRGDIRYSTRLVGRFVVRMERQEGIPNLCYLGASCDSLTASNSRLLDFVLSAGTLKECVDRYLSVLPNYNGRLTGLRLNDRWAKLKISTPISEPNAPHQSFSDWSNILNTVALMRVALGQQWRPVEISLQARTTITDDIRSDFPDTRFITAAPETSLQFPTHLLATAMPMYRRQKTNVPSSVGDSSDLNNLPTVLRSILRPYIGSENLSIDRAAEAMGRSVRSLQRALGAHGSSYSALIERERDSLARELLDTPGVSITQIAFDLGYINATHFSRAFRRMTGMSPREFRRARAEQQ